jgi:hypothetical protein
MSGRESSARLARYRCFRDLSSGRYSVQSVDFYTLSLDSKRIEELERQHMELLAEQAPDERGGAFDTLEAAIEAHDKDFASTEPK